MAANGPHTCRLCGREFGHLGDYIRHRTGRMCENGAGGEGNLKYGDNWLEQREKALERDGEACQGCGSVDDALQVHHVRPVRTFDHPNDANLLDNLVTMCAGCHGRWEGLPVRPQLI